MIQHLNANISFCELDGRLFFLDIQRDQYFQLPEALERNLLKHLKDPDDTDIDISGLIKHGLLSQAMPRRCTTTRIAYPGQSVLEAPCSRKAVHFQCST